MITVIKHGTKKKATCKICRCEFIYENEDVRKNYSGRNDYVFAVDCPDCGSPCEAVVLLNTGEEIK